VQTRNETSAGGVVVRTSDDAIDVAIIKTHEGRWQLPKGWIEDGESPEQAAVREAREEAGVLTEHVAPIDIIKYQFVSRYDPEPARVFKRVHFFLLRYVSGSTDEHDDEVTEARFVAIDEALRLLTFKDERRMVERARVLLEEAAAAGA
jgi:8-oxo-dGTP pyrophosphatase MutT (NUDIX family)